MGHRRHGVSAVDALKAALAAAALTVGSAASAEPLDRWRSLIEAASTRFAVPAIWIERVISAESRGRTALAARPITSAAGAMGLMQLMPATWTEMRDRLHLGADPYEPHDNIWAGTFFLRLMYDRFGYPGVFAAYNAGPRRYAEALTRGVPLPTETIAYVRDVAGNRAPNGIALTIARDPLFLIGDDALGLKPEQRQSGMFVALSSAGSSVPSGTSTMTNQQ